MVAVFSLVLLVSATSVLAITGTITDGNGCQITNQNNTNPALVCAPGLTCQTINNPTSPDSGSCKSGGVINVAAPSVGFKSVGNFISNALVLVFAIGAMLVLIMLITGAFEWITSGGDKEHVGKARSRIINALIGLAVLAVAYALANVLAQFTGISLTNLVIPAPNPNAPGF